MERESDDVPTPMVSVVMAAFNSGMYIESAIESILRQTLIDFELIIVDDGSSDGTRKIARECARRDPRIRILCQDHAGLVTALNKGCQAARAEYIARLDSDDLAMPERLEQQIKEMRSRDIALLGGAIECIDSQGASVFSIDFPSWQEGLRDFLLVNCYIAHTTVMFKKDLFLAVGGYRPQFEDAEDHDLFLRMSDHMVVDNLRTVLSKYRVHNSQISAIKSSQQVISSIGARVATRARRMNREEPKWAGDIVSREDLICCGIKDERIDTLISKQQLGIGTLRWREQ